MIFRTASLVIVLDILATGLGLLRAADLVPRYEIVVKSGEEVNADTFATFGQTSLMADARIVAVIATITGEQVTSADDTIIWESAHRRVLTRTGYPAGFPGGSSLYLAKMEKIRLAPDESVQLLARLSDTPGGLPGPRAFFPQAYDSRPFAIEGQPLDEEIASKLSLNATEINCAEIYGFSAAVNETDWRIAGRFSGTGLSVGNDEAVIGSKSVGMREGDFAAETENSESFISMSSAFRESAPGRAVIAALSPSMASGIWQVGL